MPEVEDLVIALILDGKVKGRIDQVNGRVELDKLCVAQAPLLFPPLVCADPTPLSSLPPH